MSLVEEPGKELGERLKVLDLKNLKRIFSQICRNFEKNKDFDKDDDWYNLLFKGAGTYLFTIQQWLIIYMNYMNHT